MLAWLAAFYGTGSAVIAISLLHHRHEFKKVDGPRWTTVAAVILTIVAWPVMIPWEAWRQHREAKG